MCFTDVSTRNQKKIINILQVQRTSKDYYTNTKKRELYQEKLTKY